MPHVTFLSFERQTLDKVSRTKSSSTNAMFSKGRRTIQTSKDTMLNYTNARTTLVPKILRNFDQVIPERCVSSIEECLHRVDFNSRWTNYGGLLKFAAKCGATVKRLGSRKSSLENAPSGKSWNDPSNEIHEFSTMNA